MGEETVVKNGRISNFQGLVTLTLDRVILHTVMHHLWTSTYTPNFIEIKLTFCGRTDGRTRTDGHLRPTLLGRLGVDLKSGSHDRDHTLLGMVSRPQARILYSLHAYKI